MTLQEHVDEFKRSGEGRMMVVVHDKGTYFTVNNTEDYEEGAKPTLILTSGDSKGTQAILAPDAKDVKEHDEYDVWTGICFASVHTRRKELSQMRDECAEDGTKWRDANIGDVLQVYEGGTVKARFRDSEEQSWYESVLGGYSKLDKDDTQCWIDTSYDAWKYCQVEVQ